MNYQYWKQCHGSHGFQTRASWAVDFWRPLPGRPDSGIVFQVTVLKTFKLFPPRSEAAQSTLSPSQACGSCRTSRITSGLPTTQVNLNVWNVINLSNVLSWNNLKSCKDFNLQAKALTVLYVPYSLDSGRLASAESRALPLACRLPRSFFSFITLEPRVE